MAPMSIFSLLLLLMLSVNLLSAEFAGLQCLCRDLPAKELLILLFLRSLERASLSLFPTK